MNTLFTKRIAALVITVSLFSSAALSQFENVDFLKSTTADGIKFLEAYISPWANAFGAGLNGGWYNTAKPHKLGGFDVTAGLNVGFVPAADETFDLSTLGLSTNMNPKTGTAPTIAGPDEGRPTMTYSVSGVTVASFSTPPGTGWKYIPVPTAQVGIGLPLGTEIKGRFIPRIPIQEGDVMLWGVGLMHSIMQYIPGNELLPVDASIFGGYTKLNGNIPVSLQPGTPQNYSTYNTASFSDQNLSVTVQAFNVSAIASVNLAVITFYGGLGYTKTSTVMNLTGNFPTPVLVTPALPATPYAEYNDSGVRKGEAFGEMNIENFSGLRANIGFRLKLAVVTIHADYTRAQYNVVSTGLGISFR
ncbi:MAG: hypothetical protein A2V64_05740 [Bacteroidetes bacterium RBG_13_43_22]|nr:MAG: hypothetical protein A2V64_05740 [Bacteroidetes bacterium RBG_13_43_22]